MEPTSKQKVRMFYIFLSTGAEGKFMQCCQCTPVCRYCVRSAVKGSRSPLRSWGSGAFTFRPNFLCVQSCSLHASVLCRFYSQCIVSPSDPHGSFNLQLLADGQTDKPRPFIVQPKFPNSELVCSVNISAGESKILGCEGIGKSLEAMLWDVGC